VQRSARDGYVVLDLARCTRQMRAFAARTATHKHAGWVRRVSPNMNAVTPRHVSWARTELAV